MEESVTIQRFIRSLCVCPSCVVESVLFGVWYLGSCVVPYAKIRQKAGKGQGGATS